MSYKRQTLPRQFVSGEKLDNDFHSLGVNIACKRPSVDPNIEDTLVSASIEGVNQKDGRIISLLVDWVSIHSERINVSRLTEIVRLLPEDKYKYVRIFWCANAQRLKKDPRFIKLAMLYKGKRVDFLDRDQKPKEYKSTPFLLKKNGEDERFLKTCIRVPSKYFSHRPHQIRDAKSIAKNHMGFRYRIMFGPSYKGDIWALLRRKPDSSAYELAKKAYASYPTAHQTKRDYEIVKRDYSGRGK